MVHVSVNYHPKKNCFFTLTSIDQVLFQLFFPNNIVQGDKHYGSYDQYDGKVYISLGRYCC